MYGSMKMDVDPESSPFEMEIDQVVNELATEQLGTFDTIMYKPTKTTYKAMYNHVVWPRYLPQRRSNELHAHEIGLIELMVDIVDDFVENDVLPNKISKLIRCLHNLKTSMTSEVILREMNLSPGEMKSIYIEAQNCCIFIYMPTLQDIPDNQPKQLIFATFTLSVTAEQITEYASSDVKMDFPAQSIKIEQSQIIQSTEFAEQLVYLHKKITEDKNNMKELIAQTYVTHWLLPLLGNRYSSVTTNDEFTMITKKIRDDVLGSRSDVNLPFRRSPFWAAIKASLQLGLTVEYGKECGKFLYKLIMLRYLTTLCSFSNTQMDTFWTVEMDNVSQMLAKMARRIEKLQKFKEVLSGNEINHEFLEEHQAIYNQTIKSTKTTIQNCRNEINAKITNIQNIAERKSKLMPLRDLDFEADAKQKVPTLREYVTARQRREVEKQIQDFLEEENWFRHDVNSTALPDVKIFDELEGQVAIGLFLCDFENWILYKLNVDLAVEQYKPESLRQLSTKYEQKAIEYYQQDPIGYSRMVLTQLKIVKIMDMTAVKAHPLYNKHESGVNDDIFDHLLLPYQRDMQIACEMQKYFCTRNFKKLPSILDDNTSNSSLACRFVESNDEMRTILVEIKKKDEKHIKEVEAEYAVAKKKMDRLKNQANPLECQCVNGNGKRRHVEKCTKCSVISKMAEIRVRRYERILPAETCQQYQVVFELAIPPILACLRDVLCGVVNYMQKKPMKEVRIFANWVEGDTFKKYWKSKCQVKCERVFLGTSSKHTLSRKKDQFESPDKIFTLFDIPNGWNLTYYYSVQDGSNEIVKRRLPSEPKNQVIEETCRFTVEESSLQWMLNGSHTHNQVIASQYECPQHLTLSEYKNFGLLRADGYILQLRKLYALIASESLSFETQSVQALIMQTIWQLGPDRKLQWSTWYRKAHQDFTNPDFVMEMCKLIENFIEIQKSNWKHPRKLMTIAMIAVRMYEMNYDNGDQSEKVTDKIVKLLQKLRDIAISWISKVQAAMQMSAQNHTHMTTLRRNLVEIAIAGALTFFVDNKHPNFDQIFINSQTTTKTAPQLWLEFLVTLNSNVLLDESNQTEANLRMFLRLIRTIGVNLQSKIRNLIENDLEQLYSLIKDHWNKSRDASRFKLMNSNSEQCFLVLIKIENNNNHNVIVDMVTGDFLVNNFPVSRLPAVITENALFKRIFGQFIFDVQQENRDSFSTIHTENIYNFRLVHNELIITELHKRGPRFELIPSKILKNEIPHLLVENYSHWWNYEGNCITFRPPQYADQNFDSVHYFLDLNVESLIHIKTKQKMLDVKSESFLQITKRLKRLESRKFTHIFISEKNDVMVKLVRMNLKFVVKPLDENEGEYEILSNEFNNMRVSLHQNYGTLYGLHHGLLLESTEDFQHQSKMLIIPHGEVEAQISKSHEIVKINTKSELRSPLFHTYLVDEFCQQLKAKNSSFSAWFYLAYLHALTSYGQVEPFLGMTGSERAIQILESAFVWSSAPYDDESLKTLKDIESLSPIRVRNVNQTVRWPNFIHSHASQDAYAIIIRKLIEDSNRLKDLHQPKNDNDLMEPSKPKETDVFDLKENQRDYFRCLPSHPNLRISKKFVDYEAHEKLLAPRYQHNDYMPKMTIRTIAAHYHENTFRAPHMFNLSEYLMPENGRRTLTGIQTDLNLSDILSEFGRFDLSDSWISLYEIARKSKCSRETFALILSLFALKNEDSDAPIFALQTVANNPIPFEHIKAPNADKYNLNSPEFRRDEIAKIVQHHHVRPEKLESEDDDMLDFMEYSYNIADLVEKQWQRTRCDRLNPYIYNHVHEDIEDMPGVVVAINAKLRNWKNIEDLNKFIESVENQMKKLTTRTPEVTLTEWTLQQIEYDDEEMKHHRFYIDYEAKMCENIEAYQDDVNLAIEIFCRDKTDPKPAINRTAAQWWNVFKGIVVSKSTEHLVHADLYPRFVPSLVLPALVSSSKLSTTNPDLRSVIGALAVTIAHEQWQRRIEIYERQPHMQADLDREQKNEPHMNWSPIIQPEWLLFEIEQNLTIRTIQIEIAERMISAPNPAEGVMHSVMQLNMGEGKTAVIIPIVASSLAKKKHACQITVLKSLFATNLKSLRQCLGGFLNHRVYTFPCRRDLPVNDLVNDMFSIYEECKAEKGVILTLPEYRLSFQLKTYESTCKNDFESAANYLKTHKWLNENVRNILDESDAILHPKYQLIYTVGNQLSLDGGNLRWTVVQALLKRIREHVPMLYIKYGDKNVEFDRNYWKLRYEIFSPVRIFNDNVYNELKSFIVKDFIIGKLSDISFARMNDRDKKVKVLLEDESISVETFNDIISYFSENEQNILLILRGLLRFDVLKLVLTKRWRVNYGVNVKSARKMAVPFKAKDVAAENTEFGHPDLAICLTHLSYYYSGLTDEQLYEVFQILDNQQDAKDIYIKWIQKINPAVTENLLDPSIVCYSGINLCDPHQRDKLVFPLLKYNMYVIDFWLSNMVFPREAKTFEKKLMCTAWDLCCGEHLKYPVTGFSGTNDTQNILPLPIMQNDLPDLIRTNEEVHNILLRQNYKSLTANISGKQILKELRNENIPVLLDAGALMLELNNEQVATEWLRMVPEDKYDAAVYFSTNDVLMTIDRNNVITEFDNSVYRDKLNKCIVYLDDSHTRGTDLKFPINWKACVTLSGDITRDKTVQACMRMRLLGRGHDISFWASHEADVRIKEICKIQERKPTTADVIQFISSNSKQFETDHITNWTSSAYNYAKKTAAHKHHELTKEDEYTRLNRLYIQCVDNEYVTLSEMYGGKEDRLLTEITADRFERLNQMLKIEREDTQFVTEIATKVNRKLSTQAASLMRHIHSLDEQQEKELENELEEQRQVQRPPPAKAIKPNFDDRLKILIKGGTNACIRELKHDKIIMHLPKALSNKQFYAAYELEEQAWADNLYVTTDMTKVIRKPKDAGDEFIRPVLWIAKINQKEGHSILLMSSFEVEHLFNDFKKSERACLYMYQPKLSQYQPTLIDNPHLMVTDMEKKEPIPVDELAQIAMFSGCLYFDTKAEQDAYCSFMGLIPRPLTIPQQLALDSDQIHSSGYVAPKNRNVNALLSVRDCKFNRNPIQLAVNIIQARHQFMSKESHVASILEKATKMPINNDDNTN